MPIELQDVVAARKRIQDLIQLTPVNLSRSCSERFGSDVYLKLENEQTTGSFKIRGSLNKVLGLSLADRAKGIIASSAGNHAQGVAYSAQKVGAKARIVMPTTSPIVKVLATQSYGAEVILHGRTYDEAYAHARELEQNHGYCFVHPFDDDIIIAGQGTLGLEVMEAIPDLDSIIVSIGGGGLISGVATAVKAIKPTIKVYGVVSDASPGMRQMFAKEPISPPSPNMTIADGISVKKPSARMYTEYISRLVDDVVEVNDDEIAEAIVFFLERAKSVVEGSGAAVWAAANRGKWHLGKKTCLVLSGGNIDLNLVSKVIERGLSQNGRLIRVGVVVTDRPGNLTRLTNIIAEKGANILDVKHVRIGAQLRMSETVIEFLLETKGDSHAQELRDAFRALGCRLIEA
jgi:threonine dehydratase